MIDNLALVPHDTHTAFSSTSLKQRIWPSVSINIITRNRNEDLCTLLQTIKQQSYPPEKIEIVIVDNSDCPIHPGPGIHYIQESPGKAIGYYRNQALKHSTGEIIIFWDDDCLITPDCLQQLVLPLIEQPGVCAVSGAVRAQQNSRIGIAQEVIGLPGGGIPKIMAAKGHVINTIDIQTCCLAVWTTVLRNLEGFSNTLIYGKEDYELGLRLQKKGTILFNPHAVVFHKPRPTLKAIFLWLKRSGWADIDYALQKKVLIKTLFQPFKLSFTMRLLFAGTLISVFHLVGLLVFSACVIAYYFRLMIRYTQYEKRLIMLLIVPAVQITMELGKGIGQYEYIIKKTVHSIKSISQSRKR